MQAFIYSILLMSCLFLSSCGNYFVQKTLEPTLDLSAQEALAADFKSIKEIIFSPKCISCHQQYDSYAGVVRELAAIQNAVSSNRMPKNGPPLSVSQKEILAVWIKKGAPESQSSIEKPNDPILLEPNWASISANIIFPKCLVCHNPAGQAKFLNLSTRQSIFEKRNMTFLGGPKFIDIDQPEKSYLLDVVQDPDEPMPPKSSNIQRLNENELKILTKWISLGLP